VKKITFHNIAGIFFPAFLVFITLFLVWKNYVPNTSLMGWDSLHSEFNFKDSLYRTFWGVWREDQGLGSVAIHSHMADLPRIISIWILSIVLPQNLIRYSYLSLTFVLGPLGVYFLLNCLLSKKSKLTNSVSSFLGSLFYMLNLGTLQHFIVPFEMFNVAFAFIPWLYLLLIKYLKEGNKKDLLWFSIVTILASPMAYAATLFYAYIGGLIVFLFFFNIFERKKIVIKRTFLILAITSLLNLYWILPNLYSIKSVGSDVSNAKINILFSPEAFIRNQDFGNWKDVLINKNFLFDWRIYDFDTNQFDNLMIEWNTHLNSPWVSNIAYVVSIISILGLLISIIKLDKVGISFFTLGLFSLFFLFNLNGPTGGIYNYLYKSSDLIREGLRTPFTKFSISFLLVTSYFFGYFFNFLIDLIKHKAIKYPLSFLVTVVISISLFFLMKPAFYGNLISNVVKKQIPNEYFEVFKWFNTHSDDRIALMPLNTPWGWEYNNWGYQGSGFLGFGISNPLLVRDYDRWSPFNETFYLQASKALYDGETEELKSIFERYKLKYLLLDESIIDAGGNSELLRLDDIKNLFSELNIKEVAKFGFLTIYDTGIENKDNITTFDKYFLIDADLNYSKTNPLYLKYGNYFEDKNGLGFPFVNFDFRGPVDIGVTNDQLLFTNKETNSEVKLEITDKASETFEENHGFKDAFNCDLKKVGNVYKENLLEGRSYKSTGGGVSCDYFAYPDLSYKDAYVLRIKGQNLKGRSLKIYLYNWDTMRVELEELMKEGEFDEYFVVYPKEKEGSGYTVNVETRSFGRIASENTVEAVEFIPFDLNLVQNLYIDSKGQFEKTGNLKILEVNKTGTSIYKIKTTGSGVLQLGQGYDEGWIAISNKKILEHVKVNSWSNGWVVSADNTQSESITWIIFWPQFLEWIGFLVLGLTTVYLIVQSRK